MSLVIRTLTLVGVVSSGIISLAGYSHPANKRSQVVEQHPPRVVMPVEASYTMPKADRLAIRMIPLEKPEPAPLPTVRPEGQEPAGEPEPKTRHRHVAERERREDRPSNVCERHHLRKVVTNGGRSWRCRR
jgi:hypothetical protein